MQIRLIERKKHELIVGISYFFIGLSGFFLVHYLPQFLGLIPPCLFRTWTGLPCPACGASHAALFLSNFQILASFLSNPFFFFIYIALAIWGVNSMIALIFGRNLRCSFSETEKKLLNGLILTAIPLNWAFLIFRALVRR